MLKKAEELLASPTQAFPASPGEELTEGARGQARHDTG
jgi:hypothetical protein